MAEATAPPTPTPKPLPDKGSVPSGRKGAGAVDVAREVSQQEAGWMTPPDDLRGEHSAIS